MPSQVVETRGRIYTIPVRPSVKGPSGLYHIDDADELAIEEKYNSITKPLTLLAETDDKPQRVSIGRKDGRPSTPIQKAITFIPTSLEQINVIIRKRICPNEVLPLSVPDQQCLAAIILGEVATKWGDIKDMPENALLDKTQNSELVRRLFVHVVTVCEELFFHYNSKLELLNKSRVFTGPANIARLRAQLALDADKFLDIGYIRRRIARELIENKPEPDVQIAPATHVKKYNLTHDELFDKSRPSKPKTVVTLANREIKDMMLQMPQDFDLDQVTDLLPDHLMSSAHISQLSARGPVTAQTSVDAKSSSRKSAREEKIEQLESKLVRSKSHQEFRWDIDNFEDEIGEFRPKPFLIDIHENAVGQARREKLPLFEIYSPPPSPVIGRMESRDRTSKGNNAQQLIAEDLEERSKYIPLKDLSENLPEEEELPPLLQASSKYNHVEGRLEALQNKLAELEQNEIDELERQRKELFESASSSQPIHPQPATISTKFPNHPVVRTNDIRVSERVSLNALTLKSYPPLYNDLNNDIDSATVRKLDARLYYDQRINEVYDDMLETAPKDYLSMELEPEVESCAPEVKLSEALASVSLLKRPAERIVNSSLLPIAEGKEPPWATVGTAEEWRRTTDGPAKRMQDLLPRLVRNKDMGEKKDDNGNDPDNPLHEERNSWGRWWRSFENKDDYFKFLACTESDYLSLAFHLFNEEDDLPPPGEDADSDEEALREDSFLRMMTPKSKQKNAKILEALKAKEHYTEGFWNARSVTLGGLGRVPNQKDAEAMQLLEEADETLEEIERASDKVSPKQEEKSMPHKLTMVLLDDKEKRDMQREQKAERKRKRAAGAMLQDRLEKVWNNLRVPDQTRLDMALKYSSNTWAPSIVGAIDGWEKCANVILTRESILAELEKFERYASDPDRFFKKGLAGSSKARLKESKDRQQFEESLKRVDLKVKQHCEYVEEKFQDVVSYGGRPYLQKMKLDRVEMLYWLQQERREQGLEREILAGKFPIHGLKDSNVKLPVGTTTQKKPITPRLLEPIK